MLATMLNNSQENLTGAEARLLASGEAYVRFAVQQPGYFSIMFQTDLINPQDPEYVAARSISRDVLEQSVRDLMTQNDVSEQKINATVIALWSQVHGFASLWLAGNFGDPDDAALLDSLLVDMLHSLKL